MLMTEMQLNLLNLMQHKNMQINNNLKGKLYKSQKGICPVCSYTIDLNTIMYSFKPVIHHKMPISKGGSRGSMSNLVLIHKGCHMEVHGMKNKAD